MNDGSLWLMAGIVVELTLVVVALISVDKQLRRIAEVLEELARRDG